VIVLGGDGAEPGAVADLVERLEAATGDSPLVSGVLGFGTRPGGTAVGRIGQEVADLLAIDGVTVLAVRPDRYVGLRHDGTDPEPVARYFEALAG
jgi:hypothetical protein